ncbi:hypothetical protein [Marinagarivorans algicola]|uniref:hypothetical protein n=1 Tax=Marinagarivorans algicola TaxID=1513270 RepID=UPI0006BA0BA4|nr:hypothetical protein [Marinagarivorans algicola]
MSDTCELGALDATDDILDAGALDIDVATLLFAGNVLDIDVALDASPGSPTQAVSDSTAPTATIIRILYLAIFMTYLSCFNK